jgi:homoserine kinase
LDAVTAYAPGSASNLGPGFDCLGLAFTGKGDRVTARRMSRQGVRVASCSDARISLDAEKNTAAIAAQAVLLRASPSIGLELSIEKGLPLAGGMGGSAASAVAGALAADALLGAKLEQTDLLACALRAEEAVAGRHLDNVAPALYGGAVLIVGVDPPRLTAIRVHESIGLVFVTPAYGVETATARAALPEAMTRADAIAQAAHLGRLVLGLRRGSPELLNSCMEDRIAEPARMLLYPGFKDARAAALDAGAHGACISGAGPTALALCHTARTQQVADAMVAAYARSRYAASVHVAGVDSQGARVVA